jgi:Ni2+-binding GTPase involved in maturation of urease and hydrogenase
MNNKSLLSEIPTIEIKGQCGSGKTTLAVLIKRALQEYGVNANITEYCGDEIEQYPYEYANVNWAACMVHFKDSTIQIKTQQLIHCFTNNKSSITLEDIEFKETPTDNVKHAIEEYTKTNNELPDNFMGFRP